MPSVYCTQCGHANPEDARFCSRCGSPLSRDTPGDTTTTISLAGIEALDGETGQTLTPDRTAVDQLAPGTSLLVVMRGPNAGSRFLLDSDLTTAGRHPESDIFLDDVTVSRRHAEFYHRGGQFTVRDVGSLNGTYVNRERIEEHPLTGGDEVQIGKFRLVFFTRSPGGA
ncbi:MAG TPA: FHA domain-containing protein [Thermopolyspora sp.]|jgi:FOG: FHA domain